MHESIRSGIVRLLLIAQIGFLPIDWAQASAIEPIVQRRDVVVTRIEEGFTVDVVIVIPVPIGIVWRVITDFEHMTEFIPDLTESQVLERKQNDARVQQKGHTHFGPFKFNLESTRDIHMTPETEMTAHGVAGNMRRVESITRLKTVAGGTRLEYHVEVQPDFWVPPLVGPFVVRDQTAEQFSALVSEMIKRR